MPARWLEGILATLDATAINVTTISEVVNATGQELWTCHFEFNIRRRWTEVEDIVHIAHVSTPAPLRRSAEKNMVIRILRQLNDDLQYNIPNFSSFKI